MKNFFWVVFTAGKLRKLWWPVESWNGLERRHTHYIFNSVIEINSHFLVTEKRNVIRIKIEHNSKFSWNVRCIGWYFHLFEYLVPEKCISDIWHLVPKRCISDIWHVSFPQNFPTNLAGWVSFSKQLAENGTCFLTGKTQLLNRLALGFKDLNLIICTSVWAVHANLDKSPSLCTPNHKSCASCI